MTCVCVTRLSYRWFLAIAQAIALEIDQFCGLVGQLVGADYGDEVIYYLCLYSNIHLYRVAKMHRRIEGLLSNFLHVEFSFLREPCRNRALTELNRILSQMFKIMALP